MNMENTYWNNKGTHQELNVQLEKLIPMSGDIKGSKNRQLERLRKASNAYYDIFNNGGCNRMRSISKFYGTEVTHLLNMMWKDRRYFNYLDGWNKIHAVVEPIIDEMILVAAKEQNISK